ncbi:MAG: electron transfer flavoprotein subunit beta/FixA family protein [Phycisphaerae bacterium]
MQVAYDIVVCVKQVPDTKNITGEAMKEDGTVNRAALPAIFNPEDLHALETALEMKERFGGTVTVVTMGMPSAAEMLRASMFRGADRGVLVTDRRAAGSDTLATSYILSCAVQKLDPDVVLCGRQAIDGDTAQVGPQLADKLDMNLVTYVEEISQGDQQKLTLKRNVGNGWEVVRVKLPVLLTVLDIANVPRPIAVKRMMKYKKALAPAEVAKAAADDAAAKEQSDKLAASGLLFEQWDLDDIGADLNWCGLAGSPTKVNRIQSIVLAGGEYKEFEPTEEGVKKLVGDLITDHTIG